MKRRTLITGVLVLVTLLAAGCVAGDGGLSGTTWRLISYMGDDGQTIRATAGATISFSGDGTLQGNAGCNSYAAEYRAGKNQIVISHPVATEMYCTDESVMEEERRFLFLITQASTYSLNGDILIISQRDGREILAFGRML
ncbi:hypothetical protein RJ53_05930 [Methanocalculus chunghsingensis]|uniref:DUF306 domain-containing protein n=1 Tax=Methanocalculus chunghsingensis TaxID=156457 RepID=A0A8J7W9V3_9EURY|nr:META domain-containing protein [Methanocalculus chunghsingensis]MBR1369062.1 hypothetical protein [Methanocalculus chunghsingensis]